MSSSSGGRLIVISGPSGVGKSTICDRLTDVAGFERVVTCTTRAPRAGEVDGRDYHFLDPDAFEAKVRNGGFLEHAIVHGSRYGTPRDAVEARVLAGRKVLLAIDVQGADQLRETCSGGEDILSGRLTTVFLLAPNESVLEARLNQRGTEGAADVARRIAAASAEVAEKDKYDIVIVNDDLDAAVRELTTRLARPCSSERSRGARSGTE